jgi:RecA/RadA recombinase
LAGLRAQSARLVSAADEKRLPANAPSSYPTIEALLDGDLPRGRLCELVGPRGSGRMSAALAMTAAVQARGELVAFVDVADALDPRSAVRAGVELSRLLWVRPKSVLDGLKAADWILDAGGFGLVIVYLAATDVGVVAGDTRLSVAARARMVRGEAPWVKLARRAERAKAALVIVAERALAGTIAAMTLATERARPCWLGGGLSPRLLDGTRGKIAVVRNKLGPPPDAVELRLQVSDDRR